MYQTLDGELLPAEVTLVRVQRAQDNVIAIYIRDLREQKKLQAEKRTAEERMQIMLDATPLGCTLWNKHGQLIDCNHVLLNWVGLNSKQEFLTRVTDFWPEFQPSGERSIDLASRSMNQALQTGSVTTPWMQIVQDGSTIPCEATLVRVMGDGEPMLAIFIRNLSEEVKLQAEKQEANDYTQLMLDATPLSCVLWNEDSQMVACNQEAVKLFGLRDKQEYFARYDELSPENQPCGRLSRELTLEHVSTAFRFGYARFEWMHQQLDGEPVPVEVTLVRVSHKGGFIVAGYSRDLRELKNTVNGLKRMEAMAYTDKLTGVGNRHYFLEHAAAELATLGPHKAASLLLLDIDHFKRVNDTYGHNTGDVILQDVAKRIRQVLRPGDLFARYGGEEFVILVTANLDLALSLAERIRNTIAQDPFTYPDLDIEVTISIGVTQCNHATTPLEDLVDQADSALYQAKRNGRNRVEHNDSPVAAKGQLV